MLCQFERVIYPRPTDAQTNASGYMIAIYRPCGKIQDMAGNCITQIKAVGYCLPTAEKLQYELHGHWTKNPKHGVQYEVDSFEEVIVPTKEGIIAYLSSGQIRGVGLKTAERIYEAFGKDTLKVLDEEPQKLLAVHGISKGRLQKIQESYLASHGARDVITFLAPHGITPNRAVKLYREYGAQTMEIVRNHPYQLCEIAGIGFRSADKIAMSMGIDKLSPERVDEGLLYTLQEAEGKGHLCMEKHQYIEAARKILDTPELTTDMAATRASKLVQDGKIMCYKGYAYRTQTAKAEMQMAYWIDRMNSRHLAVSFPDLPEKLDEEEKKLGLRLDPEQRKAVLMALQSPISVITGGPGTGKTSIQKAILDIYSQLYPDKEILCCAPTGRAARRMEESTGFPAFTVHKALCLVAGEDGQYSEPEMCHADLILVDEVSMLDIFLAKYLLQSIPSQSQLVLIGDSDQLPSVGPGAVLSEIIKSGVVPVVRLDKVHRQSSGSRIAVNARLIRHGNLGLDYGSDFQFYDSPDLERSAGLMEQLYLQETAKYGVDHVALLTPYRLKTATGAAVMNELIREQVNPPAAGKPEIQFGKRVFRVGDKVMQMKNRGDINNGDIGYITGIRPEDGESVVLVDYGDGRNAEYLPADLHLLDFGYATTIHKSQGSEYQSVIINLQCAHSIMLVRPLLYTAITRAKKQVIIVGDRRALCIAIKKQDAEKRGTQLSERLIELSQKRKGRS